MISIHNSSIHQLVEFVKNNYGINLESKKHLIEGRLNHLITEKGFQSLDEYVQYVIHSDSKEEISFLLNKLTTNHTFFMREKEHFNFFEQHILPKLKKEVKDMDLRIWSAGCSSGEEAYTLAMIMQSFFGKEAGYFDKKILATDISANVLEKAKSGIFSMEAVNTLPSHWKYDYFKNLKNGKFQVIEKLRKEIIFRSFNLMEEFPFRRKFHVIFCRNVMIYFDQKTKERLIQKFYDYTEDGGFLFIGLSESIKKQSNPYQYVMPSVYRKG